MVWESILFMCLMCLGVFQVIAAWAHLRGMSFFSGKFFGYVFGILVMAAAFGWFFTTIEFGEGGPKGQHDDQFFSFTIGLFGALLLTWVISSIIHAGSILEDDGDNSNIGIEVFKTGTFFQVISRGFLDVQGDD